VAFVFARVEVLESPDNAATHYAQIHADLKRRGQMIGANDLFIAAHARSLGLRLVTNNTAEFGSVICLEFLAVTICVEKMVAFQSQPGSFALRLRLVAVFGGSAG
jgi:hypothetical protein